MIYFRKKVIILAFAAIALASAPAIAELQKKIEFSRTYTRSFSPFHKRGYANVASARIRQYMRGVISQAILTNQKTGKPETIEILIDFTEHYPGYIKLVHSNKIYKYHIRYNDLVPTALFANSGGTSLFTILPKDKVPDQFSTSAGFAQYTKNSYIAFEFLDTKFAIPLAVLDTCSICFKKNNAVTVKNMNKIVQNLSIDKQNLSDESGTYINIDLASPFHVANRSARLQIKGDIQRIRWRISSERANPIIITRSQSFVKNRSDLVSNASAVLLKNNTDRNFLINSIAKIENKISEIEEARTPDKSHIDANAQQNKAKRLKLLQGIKKTFQKLLDRLDSDTKKYKKEINLLTDSPISDIWQLFNTLALFRTIKEVNPKNWTKFIETISSKKLVQQDPTPWKRYENSLCSVHAKAPVCNQRRP